jgi:HSP20 family protein
MTMFFDEEVDRLFKRMTSSFFNLDEQFDETKSGSISSPFYYGYTMTIGPDGRPVVKEYGNIRPGLLPNSDSREPLVDTIVDNKTKVIKLVAEMPGVEKSDVKVVVKNGAVNIDAVRGNKKYHTVVPIQYKVDKDTAKASYKNGILELTFKQLVPEKSKGKTVEVQ